MSTRFTLTVTSDRYNAGKGSLEIERAILDRFPDFNADVRGSTAKTEEELIEIGQDSDCLLCSTRDRVTRNVLENSPRVKAVAIYGVGLNNVDLDAATDLGVVVTHYPDYCTNEVADHAMGLLLALNRRIIQQNAALHHGAWIHHGAMTTSILRADVKPLRELTLGIIGFGRIGQRVAHRARPFGLNIIAADPNPDSAALAILGVTHTSLDNLLTESDLITIHCPLLPATYKLLGAEQLARTKDDVVIVNTARGPIIDIDALVQELQTSTGKRAGLDVTDPEPLPEAHPLYTMENVVLTPHSAYYSERAVHLSRTETLVDAINILRGYRPRTVANPRVLDKVSLIS